MGFQPPGPIVEQEVGTKGPLITPNKHLQRLEFSLSLAAKGYQYISDISLFVGYL